MINKYDNMYVEKARLSFAFCVQIHAHSNG